MRVTLMLSMLTTAAAALACDAVPLVAPTRSTVRLVVADTSVPNGGSTTITAAVTEAAGTPVHDGTVVTFSTTLGAVHPPEAPTARGRAGATFTAGEESGAADLVAYSGDAVSEAVRVAIGAAAAAAVHLTARPASLPPTGGRPNWSPPCSTARRIRCRTSGSPSPPRPASCAMVSLSPTGPARPARCWRLRRRPR